MDVVARCLENRGCLAAPMLRETAGQAMTFFANMRGTTQSPPMVSLGEMAWSWLGSCLDIAAVALLHRRFFEGTPLTLMVGSFGASAVLIYGAIKSPLAQPRNLLGGHLLSALVGVSVQQLLPGQPWLVDLGALIILVIALLVNNLPARRRYTEFWLQGQAG